MANFEAFCWNFLSSTSREIGRSDTPLFLLIPSALPAEDILHTYICDITSHKSKFSTIISVFPLFFCKWDILTYGLHTSGRFHDRTKRSYSSDGPNTRDTWSVDKNNYTCEIITTSNVNWVWFEKKNRKGFLWARKLKKNPGKKTREIK